MIGKGLTTVLALSVLTVSVANAQGDAVKGKVIFETNCTACHGPDASGNKALGAPALAGQQAWYVARQLENFKAGIRGADAKDTHGQQMRAMAMALATDADAANVAAYVASLKPAKVENEGIGDAAQGAGLYGTCAACHGPNGEGNQATNGPRLNILQDWYIVRQLENFKAGIRGGDARDTFGATMKPMAATLADEAAVKNVAAHITKLKK